MAYKLKVILSSINHSRLLKRINTLKKIDSNLTIYGFERDSKNLNEIPSNLEIINLGIIKNGKNFFKRFLFLLKQLRFLKSNPDSIFYVTSMDLAFICMINRTKYIYEVSDLVYTYFNSLLRIIFRYLDKQIIKKSKLTIMTSEGFRSYLFNQKEVKNIIIQPNKLNPNIGDRINKLSKINIKSLKFSFIGLIRYPKTVFKFAKIIGEYFPNHEFHFYGNCQFELITELNELTSSYPNIFSHGSFRNPDDLDKIYSNSDLIVCCYQTETINEKIAEPNKFYESIYFKRPIIVSENSLLSKKVNTFHTGFSINPYNQEEIINFINNINEKELIDISYNLEKFDSNNLIDNDKYLIKRIKEILL